MRLELLESLSIPGDPAKPNEDSFSHAARAAAVFDGATGLGERLMPGRSDAQWIAQFGARRFRAHAENGEGGLRESLRAAEIAYASAVLATPDADGLRVLWFGDCAALLRNGAGEFTILGDIMDMRESERARVTRLAKPGRGPTAAGVREEFLPALRASRNSVNSPGGDWLFAPDIACADHAKEARVAAQADSPILLASDGFLALTSDYGRYSPETLLAAAAERGLAVLGEELRAVEASDPEGLRYPRFKRSDDATALLLALRA